MNFETRIRSAFEAFPPSPAERKLICLLAENPGQTSSQLARRAGYKGPGGWNGQFGNMCARRFSDAPQSLSPPGKFWSVNIVHFDNSNQKWTLRPEAVTVFRELGII